MDKLFHILTHLGSTVWYVFHAKRSAPYGVWSERRDPRWNYSSITVPTQGMEESSLVPLASVSEYQKDLQIRFTHRKINVEVRIS